MSNLKAAQKFAAKKEFKTQSCNMFTNGIEVYSYGYHFCISRWLNDNTVLFNSIGYSNSASKHQSLVRIELSKVNAKIIFAFDLFDSNKNVEITNTKIGALILKMKRATKNKEYYKSAIFELVDNAKKYCDWSNKPLYGISLVIYNTKQISLI